MYVKQLQVVNYRNYQAGEVTFTPGTNVIYGQNARGKTNLLEAVNMLSTARSHRFSKEREMILFGRESATIRGQFVSRERDYAAELKLFCDKKKQIKINGAPLDKASLLMGYFNVVMFCPEELRLVKGAPRERRKMLDLGICQLRRTYFHSLIEYNKILDQRNKLLKDHPDSDMLWVWSEKLAQAGSKLIWFRRHYLQRLSEQAALIHRDICGEPLELQYRCGVELGEADDQQDIEQRFAAELERSLPREQRFGMSLVGPHRDDFEILIHGKDAKRYASQGQQRTAALSLKMAEVRLIEQTVGEPPVLLLDDVLSELDLSRQSYVLSHIHGMQVIITCTDRERFEHIGHVNQIDVESVKK